MAKAQVHGLPQPGDDRPVDRYGRALDRPVCDFCTDGEPIQWCYPVSGFALLPTEDDSGWAACDTCVEYVERDDVDGLIERVSHVQAGRARREMGMPVTPAVIAETLREPYRRFWEAKGERMPVDPDSFRDPTEPTFLLPQRRMAEFAMQEGDTLGLDFTRTPEAIERDGEQATFSPEVVEDMGLLVKGWVMSRIARRMQLKGVSAKRARLEVRVVLDDDPEDRTIHAAGHLLDGGHRLRRR